MEISTINLPVEEERKRKRGGERKRERLTERLMWNKPNHFSENVFKKCDMRFRCNTRKIPLA